MGTRLRVEGPDAEGQYKIYELHTGLELMIYEGPNPMHHILQLQQTLAKVEEPHRG